jgi:hypothetical protein
MGIKIKKKNTQNEYLLARIKSKNLGKKKNNPHGKLPYYKGNERSSTCWNCGNVMIIRLSKSNKTYYCESCKRYWRAGGVIYSGRK